jgi:molybdenum-dependent DNA-binding transcriptional regulator ModE
MGAMDMNLLAALDALLAEGSVTGAARRLGLSSSAMSRTLARLRSATGDPLLVRAGRGLAPTPRASELRDRVHELTRDVRAVLTPNVSHLDVASLERTFPHRPTPTRRIAGCATPLWRCAVRPRRHGRAWYSAYGSAGPGSTSCQRRKGELSVWPSDAPKPPPATTRRKAKPCAPAFGPCKKDGRSREEMAGHAQAQEIAVEFIVVAGEEQDFAPISTLRHMVRQAGNDETGGAGMGSSE